jgi:hypothetical protein
MSSGQRRWRGDLHRRRVDLRPLSRCGVPSQEYRGREAQQHQRHRAGKPGMLWQSALRLQMIHRSLPSHSGSSIPSRVVCTKRCHAETLAALASALAGVMGRRRKSAKNDLDKDRAICYYDWQSWVVSARCVAYTAIPSVLRLVGLVTKKRGADFYCASMG